MKILGYIFSNLFSIVQPLQLTSSTILLLIISSGNFVVLQISSNYKSFWYIDATKSS